VQPFVREIVIENVPIRVLNIDGLLRTKTDYREKDVLDKRSLCGSSKGSGQNRRNSREVVSRRRKIS
jgi:hypothetical protein